MGKIGVMADKETSIYFKLGGVKNTWVVKSQEEAVKTFDEIKAKQLVSLVIATEPVFDWIKDRLGKSKKEIELPLVVSIPTRKGGKAQVDLLADLIKRSPSVASALQRYNGCVRGTNTPNCHTYSGKVLKFAEQAATQMLSFSLAE